ncbi:alcohol dehydrogenase catalytic domain-containing protein [Phytoactinopolyspora halotolerans]|uniref:alcohol dehydrogenase catalytic domain-containing protein n=1 Tax=Phytoactinopolyspora halotolerans TaxID=1981512 RepID=UPI001C204D08|nr:alcohol dehydrogenase catalytic domain-containing protein [Phytoactinopolyspora halotolerans]
MRSVQAVRFGGPDVLHPADVEPPVVQPAHVVVQVAVAEVLFLDTQLRSGWGADYFPVQPPYIPGAGVAGTVIAVGDGVHDGWLGRTVVAETGFSGGTRSRPLSRSTR